MKSKRNNKRHFITLMEVLVAMVLTAALLSILLFFYREASELNKLNEQAIQENFQLRYIDNRLSDVFSHLNPSQDNQRPFYFFSTKAFADTGVGKGQALVFGYNNGVKKNPLFSSDVVGVLFLDRFQRLSLITAPPPSKWEHGIDHIHKEILMEGVKEITFLFTEPKKMEAEQHVGVPGLNTVSEWDLRPDKKQGIKKKDNRVPAIIKMAIKLEKTDRNTRSSDREFTFVLPRYNQPILYLK
jgi:hypothetical protein